MKRYLKTWIISIATVMSFSACQQQDEWKDELEKNALPEDGYFTASFFTDTQHPQTRAAITGGSEQIQSLLCLIYKKEYDESYSFVTEREVIPYKGTEGNVTPQTHTWPLQTPETFTLPNGDYKAVFIGNIDPKLFADQKSTPGNGLEPILTGYKDGFNAARIHMPHKGPLAFNAYNMYYLCTVDFNQNNPKPDVLLQRIVCNNVYTRKLIDENKCVEELVNNIVSQIRNNQLTTDVVKGLLESKLLSVLEPLLPITSVLTAVVDHLVNGLAGELISILEKTLLDELTQRLHKTLIGNAQSGEGLLGIHHLLNPWETVEQANLNFNNLTKSIDFNKSVRSVYRADIEWNKIPIQKGQLDNSRQISIICLSGTEQISKIDVGNNSKYQELLRPIFDQIDDKLLNGLLVNIHTPLKYSMEPNLRYETSYELLNLKLNDNTEKDPVTLTVNLDDIVHLENLVKGILGNGLIGSLIGALTDQLLQPVLGVVKEILTNIEIKLPDLGLGNIQANGTWDAIHVSNGTIAPPLAPTQTN